MKETCLIVAPHPDDETIGAGAWMDRHRLSHHVKVLHLTSGSPRDPSDAKAAGFRTRKEYAAARRRELLEALSLVGIARRSLRSLGYVDRDVYLHMPDLVARMAALVTKLRPSVVL